ncbi:YfhO family protein [bacterium]|nr:YfhO family protein [bacterium]
MRAKDIRLFCFIFLSLIIIFFSKILFKPCCFFIQDILYQFHPYRVFAQENIIKGTLPLWNPYIYSGMPFLANLQSSLFYPFTILFYLFNFPLAYKFFVVLHLFMGGYFFALLMKSLSNEKIFTKRVSNIAILISAALFMFNGCMSTRLQFLSILGVIIWIPLIVLLFRRGLKDKKIILFLSLSLSYQFFSGHIQYLIYTILILFFYAFFEIFMLKKGRIENNLIKVGFVFIAGGGMSIVFSFIQFLPSLEFLNLSVRGGEGFDYAMASIWSFSFQRAITFISPFFFGNPVGEKCWGEGQFWATCVYIGLFPLLFSLFYLLFKQKDKIVCFFNFCLISCVILAFGYYTPVYYLLYRNFFFFRWIRYPVTFMFLSVFFLCIVSGLSIDYLTGYILGFFGKTDNKAWMKKKQLWIKGLIFIAIMIDLFIFGMGQNPYLREIFFSVGGEKIEFLKKDKEIFRFFLAPNVYDEKDVEGINHLHAWINLKDNLYSNINVPFHLFNFDGQDIRIKYFDEFLDALVFSSSVEIIDKLLDLVNVKYLLNSFFPNVGYKKMKDGKVSIYQNVDFLPRAFFVNKAKFLPEKEILKYMKSHDFNPSEEVILESSSVQKTKGQEHSFFNEEESREKNKGEIAITEYEPNKVEIKYVLKKSAWLVLTDTYYPGWRVYVNGMRKQIYKADYCFRAIYLPQGKSMVRFFYEIPHAFRIGLYVTVFSIILLLIKMKNTACLWCKAK